MSIPASLARDIERAARREGTSFSGWLSSTAARELKLERARTLMAEWERENGRFTPEEIAEAEVSVRRMLREPERPRTRRSA